MKRLKKENEFYNGLMRGNNFVEIYINPTSSEISTVKKSDDDNAIRGLIYDDGTEFCWIGNILHVYMDSYCSKENITLNINSFRFAYEPNEQGWIFDAHSDYTFDELMEKIIQYKDKLSKYGNLNDILNLFYASNNGHDYDKYNYEGINTFSDSISFENIECLEKFYNSILKNKEINEIAN